VAERKRRHPRKAKRREEQTRRKALSGLGYNCAVKKSPAKYRHTYMWVIFYTIISFLFIYIGHQVYLYVSQPYTKKKFIIESQIERYKSIIRELQEQTANPFSEPPESQGFEDVETDLEEYMRRMQMES
jgi:hypothetical protein